MSKTMVDAGKQALVPKLRFPEFRDAAPWTVQSLSELLDYERPDKYIVSDTNYGIAGTPVLTANKSFILGYTAEVTGVYESIPAIIFDDFTTDNKFVDFPFKVKSSAIKILTAKHGANIRFTYELMRTIRFDPAEHKRYYISVYQKLPLAAPSLAEQQKIADCLSSLDALIAAHTDKLAALKTHKQGLLQQLFPRAGETVPRLRFPEFRNAGAWEEKLLPDVCHINPRRAALQDDMQISFIPMASVSEDGRLEGQQIRRYGEVKTGYTSFADGDVIIAKITPCFENGKAARLAGLKNGIGFGSTEFHAFRAKKNCCSRFLFVQLYREEVRRRGAESMVGNAGQQRVQKSFFENLKFFLPSMEEQRAIVDFLSSFDNLIAAQTDKIAALKRHKQGLLQQLFPAMDAVVA